MNARPSGAARKFNQEVLMDSPDSEKGGSAEPF